MEEQRVGAGVRLPGDDLADRDDMVAALELGVEPAHEPGDAAVDHRSSVLDPVVELGELLVVAPLGREQP